MGMLDTYFPLVEMVQDYAGRTVDGAKARAEIGRKNGLSIKQNGIKENIDVAKWSVFQLSQSTAGDAIGGAIAGGLLLGPLGAIAGATGGGIWCLGLVDGSGNERVFKIPNQATAKSLKKLCDKYL